MGITLNSSCDVEEFVVEKGIDFVILDNLMALSLLTLDGDKYERQTQFINRICNICKKIQLSYSYYSAPKKADRVFTQG